MVQADEPTEDERQLDARVTTAVEAIAAVRQPGHLAEVLLDGLVRALDGDGARLFMADAGAVALVGQVARETGSALAPPGPAEKGLAARALASRSIVAVEDTAAG